jgi:hypothetical protein
VIQEQRRFWAEEDAHEAKKKADAARAAKAKASREDKGVGFDRLDENGNLVEGSLAAARQARLDATHQQKRRRGVIGRRMGRSIHDGSFSGLGGIRSGRRLDQRGPFSSWYGGAGDMDYHQGGDGNIQPGMRGPPGHGKRDDNLHPPDWPRSIPAITPSGGEAPKDGRTPAADATKALEDTAASTKATADAVGQLAPPAKEAADGAKKTADAAKDLQSPVKDLVTGLGDAAQGLVDVHAKVGEAVTGITQVVKAVNDLKSDMAKLKQALDQLQKAA